MSTRRFTHPVIGRIALRAAEPDGGRTLRGTTGRPSIVGRMGRRSRSDWTNEDWNDHQAKIGTWTNRVLRWQVALFMVAMVLILWVLAVRLLMV